MPYEKEFLSPERKIDDVNLEGKEDERLKEKKVELSRKKEQLEALIKDQCAKWEQMELELAKRRKQIEEEYNKEIETINTYNEKVMEHFNNKLKSLDEIIKTLDKK